MFVSAGVLLLTLLSINCDAVENEEIINGIVPITKVMHSLHDCARSFYNPYDINVFELNKQMADIGHKLFPNLKDFAKSYNRLNECFNESGVENDFDDKNDGSFINGSYEKELIIFKHTFDMIQRVINSNDLVKNIENNTIIQKFKSSILDKINLLKNVFIEFIDKPDMNNKNVLTETCNTTNGMKDVLTDIHIEIINKEGNNDTLHHLLDGGVSLDYSQA